MTNLHSAEGLSEDASKQITPTEASKPKRKWNGNLVGLIGGLLAAGLIVGFLILSGQRSRNQAAEAYTLVPDKISESAAIVVQLPEGISFPNFDPKLSVHFSPDIKGNWELSASSDSRFYRFLPEEKLGVGTYYLATLETTALKMEKMFSVDKDPTVLAIFPKQEAEVAEYANITIMFSRPMVALSALSENADITPPVTISPKTEGRFKWITTRTLQFIPTTRLSRASQYRVAVGEGLRSLDGVSVPPFLHTFTTRSLAYQSDGNWSVMGHVTHAEPIRVYFNQPFDLGKTRALITLSASSSNFALPFVASYGTRVVADPKTGKTKTLSDQSILEIYLAKDSHGRSYLWDFGATYHLAMTGAVPLEGDVPFTVPMSRDIQIEEIITAVTAESARSNLVSPGVFDPEGTLTFHLSESLNLERSTISGKGIAKIAYGEKCREPAPGEEVVLNNPDCVKVSDQKSIVVSFTASQFALGETSSVNFKKLENTDGVVLSLTPIAQSFTTYKKFEILRTTPNGGAPKGSITELVLCSTNPIAMPLEADFYKQIKSNMMIGKWNWGGSFFVSPGDISHAEMCPVGSYLTTIQYGLVPKFAYELSLSLDDHFGQHVEKTLRFTTADADPLEKGLVHMQPVVLMTPPSRTTLTYGLDFMGALDVTVCKVSPKTMLRYRVMPPDITSSAASLSCEDTATKHVTLPESYATRKYVQLDLHDYFDETVGNYIAVISNPDYRRVSYRWEGSKRIAVLGEMLYEKTFVTVTNLAVGGKQVERTDYNAGYRGYMGETRAVPASFMSDKWPKNLYWVNDFRSLNASKDAVVTPYALKEKSLIALPAVSTDAEGLAETPSADNIAGAVVSLGGDSAIISNSTDALSYAGQAEASRREYVYTDRPIYRPGDTVEIKGISRMGYDAVYEAGSGSSTVEIRDAAYKVARTAEVRFNKNGTYVMTFILDSKAALGYYQISSNTGGYGSFQVEEYVAPAFKVGVTSDKEEYVSGDTAKLNIAADYYFGVPLESGSVEYRIVSQDYYFDRYHDAYFNFGGSWYTNENGWYGDHFITSGKLSLGSDGKASLAQELQIDKLFSGDYRKQSKVLSVYVTVKNGNGQSVSSQHSFILHRGTFYTGITMDDYFYVTGKSGTVKIKTVDIKGVPIQRNALTLTLNRVDWKSYKRQEVDGNFYYRTERILTKVSDSTLNTDNNGDGSAPFVAGESGEYEFGISGTDDEGNPVSAVYNLYVAGSGSVYVRPTNNASLELSSSKTNLMVGDIGSFVIKSPYAHAKALVTLARGNVYEHKVLDLTSQLTKYEFTVTENEIPGLSAQVLLLAPLPEVKYGELFFQVGTKEKELKISVIPNKKVYLPGEEVTLNVHVTDAFGKPVQAELSLSIVDESVLALVGNPKKDLVSFFYGGEPLTIRTSANVKNVLHVAEIPTGTKGGSGGGGEDLDKKKRGVFRDTAYWEGTVETDASGNAVSRFTLPDNLTEWQVESVGVTKDTKVGTGYMSFTSRKTIMAVPLKPRFILPGDTFAVGGTIFNESDEPQKLDVSVSSPAMTFTGETQVSVTIAPHASLSVSFPALAPESVTSGAHEFTLRAKNSMYEDTVTNTFPIKENNTYEFSATAGRITDQNWKEEVYLPKNVVSSRGELTISLGATLATMLDSAVEGMLIYPYECSEQVASKLRTIAIVKQNAEIFGTTSAMLPPFVVMGDTRYTIDEIVNIGLAKLYQNEGEDGGVSVYPNTPESYWVTLSALKTYIELKRAGYAVDENKMTLAAQYVFNWVNYPRAEYQPTREDIIESAYVLAQLGNARFESDTTREKLFSYANNKDTVQRGLSTPALAYLAILSTNQKFGAAITNRLFAEFENRSHIDARGTTVAASIESPSLSLENSISNTALALKAFAETKRESPLLEGYLRAIKNSKSHDGGWSSTFNSITVIDATTQYLKWKNEANAKMNIRITRDGSEILAADFNKTNILASYATSVPVSMLGGGVNHVFGFIKKNLGITPDAYYYDMLLRYYLPAASIAPRDEGFSVTRAFYRLEDTEFAHPVTSAVQGEVLRGRVLLSTPDHRAHVSIEDFIPAGVEIINQQFATEDQTLGGQNRASQETYGMTGGTKEASWFSGLAQIFSFGGSVVGPNTSTDGVVSDEMYGNKSTTLTQLYPTALEQHDDRIFAYVTQLEPGEYVYEYFVRALVPGTYQHLPLVVSELYTPENFGRTNGEMFMVTKKENK